MAEKFKSKALEANLAETRYKDIKITPEYQEFIDLSIKYFGIHKRAYDCVVEFQHPFSNRKFVSEELRKILLSDYWYYMSLNNPEKAFAVPIDLLSQLLIDSKSANYHLIIIKTILEFIKKIAEEEKDFSTTINKCCDVLQKGFEKDSLSFIKASKYFDRYLSALANSKLCNTQIFNTNYSIYKKNIEYWEENTQIENWIANQNGILNINKQTLVNQIGKPWFTSLYKKLKTITNWNDLINELPNFDMIASRFESSISLFDTFIEKFYYSFYLLQIDGMASHKERIIWSLNSMLTKTIEEVDEKQMKPFIDQIFEFCKGLQKDHASSVLDIILTLGKKIIDIDKGAEYKLIHYFENKLINFGFETPGIVYVNEDWQLSVNDNHIKNIGVWMELIEYSQLEMEELLAVLIVNLKLGGIFLSDTDLFQREITKILNSNIAPFYKNVKQLTRI